MNSVSKPEVAVKPIVELKDVNKWYDDFHCLKDINLSVTPVNGSLSVALPVPVNPR